MSRLRLLGQTPCAPMCPPGVESHIVTGLSDAIRHLWLPKIGRTVDLMMRPVGVVAPGVCVGAPRPIDGKDDAECFADTTPRHRL